MFTVQYLVSIISRKGEEQADGCYAERELHIEDLLRCRRRVMEGLNLQQGVRVEATWSHSGCALSSGQITILREGEWWWWIRLRLDVSRVNRQRWPGIINNIAEIMSVCVCMCVWGGGAAGASGGQPQAYTSLCLFKLICLLFFLCFLTSHYTHCTTPTELPLCPPEWREH